ncbi:MAG: alkaline phosphatase family protein [Candidatus Eisenbacteria bacterium]
MTRSKGRKGGPRDRRNTLPLLLAAAAGFTLAVGVWLGLAGLSTSALKLTMGPRQVLPLLGAAFAAYVVAGLVALLLRLARGSRRRAAGPRRALLSAMAALTVWVALTVTFLPLKGTEAFVDAGRLTTMQLNLLGLSGVLVAGLLAGLIVALILDAVILRLTQRLSSTGTRVLTLALATVAVALALTGSIVRGPDAPLAGGTGAQIPRVVLVGVDGCDWEQLEPLVRAGRLPTFERLMSDGCYGPLLSLEELVSPRIWTTIATGKNPEKHGIHGFVNAEGVPVNSTMRTASPLWNIVSAHGVTVGVTGWYVTWPVDDVNGFLISDRVHSLLRGPAQILQSITGEPTNERLERFGGFTFDPSYKSHPVTDKRYQQNRIVDEPLRWGYLRDHIYSELGYRLYPFYRPSFSAIYFRGVDFVEHFFWKYGDPEPFTDVTDEDVEAYGDVIANYYVYQDGLLKRLLESLGDDVSVVLVSDHGFQPRTDPPPERPQLTGKHERKAVLIASGPAFRSTGYFEGATVQDVAPTILAVMGLPVAEDMDGRVLIETIEGAHLREHPIEMIVSYEPLLLGEERPEIGSTMDESIREQLKSLGYIE